MTEIKTTLKMADRADDYRFMAAAIRLARRHLGETAENPSVGAIIVGADGTTIVGHGVTETGGRPHAETQALKMAGENARGGTAYVTLEPCSHYGKTPPCANALINAGIKRVVISIRDPDKRVSGRGIRMLEDAGIVVETGILANQAYEGLSAYLVTRQLARPEVTLKMAISADNGIGVEGERNVQISNGISHSISHIMRAENAAIAVGIKTVFADNPELTCRLPGLEERSPIRVVIDRKLSIGENCRLVETAKHVPTWIIAGKNVDPKKKAGLEKSGIDIFELDDKDGEFAPRDILNTLYQKGISSLLLEGGRATACSFLDHGLVDRIALFRSKLILGKKEIAAPDFSKYLVNFNKVNEANFGEDSYSEWRCRRECLPE